MGFPHTEEVIQQFEDAVKATASLLRQYKQLTATQEAGQEAQRQRAESAAAALAAMKTRAESAEADASEQRQRADAMEKSIPVPVPGPTVSERLDSLLATLREKGIILKDT